MKKIEILKYIFDYTDRRQLDGGFNLKSSLVTVKNITDNIGGTIPNNTKLVKELYNNELLKKHNSKYYLNPYYYDRKVLQFLIRLGGEI